MNIDKIITRFSNLSQVGMFLFSMFSVYYFVIPIYQKEIISEELAKKEVELKTIKKEIEKSIVIIKEQQSKLSVITLQKLTSSIYIECTGIMSNSGSFYDEMLKIDIDTCMNNVLTSSLVGELTNIQLDKIKNKSVLLAVEAEVEKKKAINEIKSITIKNFKKDDIELSEFQESILHLRHLAGATEKDINDFYINVEMENIKHQIMSKYQKKISVIFEKLKDIDIF
ncbi:hypothetical protein CBP31_12050 [Oceanisphaera profunda]|uniref:Uncharacterized protein n=1 Tax=Oceanisphaera profunda TaxID=1416627 RepID=A0A1Y0D6S8_9GAMM|nr:hypothetical protein [Oceanisphaera profunda]ART83262.1 hypothetical protein CBP31_12050 [Oceanisphaera profunda]